MYTSYPVQLLVIPENEEVVRPTATVDHFLRVQGMQQRLVTISAAPQQAEII